MNFLGDNPEEYYKKLGEFVHKFSTVEGTFYTFLRLEFHDGSQALFSLLNKSSLSHILDAVQEVYSSKKDDESKRIISACKHMLKLSQFRNTVIHNPSMERDIGIYSIDMIANALGKSNKSAKTSADTFDDIIHDLQKIYAILTLSIANRFAKITVGKNNSSHEEAMKPVNAVLSSPWRYKHQPYCSNPKGSAG